MAQDANKKDHPDMLNATLRSFRAHADLLFLVTVAFAIAYAALLAYQHIYVPMTEPQQLQRREVVFNMETYQRVLDTIKNDSQALQELLANPPRNPFLASPSERTE